MNIFKGRGSKKESRYASMLNGITPIFSQFGQDVYASDIVQSCIDITATECSKLTPKHIWVAGDIQKEPPDKGINRLLSVSPNEIMTTSEFLERVIWQLELNYNVFIYPQFDIEMAGNRERRIYKALYPLSPTVVTFVTYLDGSLGVTFRFSNGLEVTFPYSEVIHIRKKFSVSDIMGGGLNGQPDNEAILKTLNLNHQLLQGLEKGIKSSMALRLVFNLNSYLDRDNIEAEREKFEKALEENTSGIFVGDLKSDIVPIKADPKLIDKDTAGFIQDKILNYYGVPLPILSGDFTDEQYQAFYEKKLEPLLIRLGQAFTKTMLTRREIDIGQKIIFYPQQLLFSNSKNKIAIADILGNRGALTNNQLLEMFGYPPYDGGDKRYVSLNYIESQFAAAYQLKKIGKENTDG